MSAFKPRSMLLAAVTGATAVLLLPSTACGSTASCYGADGGGYEDDGYCSTGHMRRHADAADSAPDAGDVLAPTGGGDAR